MVAGSLGEIFTLLEHPDLSAIHLASDRAFENGSVDKCGFGVRVSGGRPAGSVFDEYALHAFARNVRNGLIEHYRDLCGGALVLMALSEQGRCGHQK
jgi:hypothetical protein